MRGLIIAEPWIDLILSGQKTWELRTRNARLREKIALIRKGSGRIVGTAQLADVKGPMTSDQLQKYKEKHCVPEGQLSQYVGTGGSAYAKVLEDVSRFEEGVPYRHPSGAVTWATLSDDCLVGTSPIQE